MSTSITSGAERRTGDVSKQAQASEVPCAAAGNAENEARAADKSDPRNQRVHLDYDPFPKQGEFHASRAKYRLFDGAAGPGKSKALLIEAILQAQEHAGANTLLLRRTFPELEQSLLLYFRRDVPRELYKSFNESKHLVTWWNGSTTRFAWVKSLWIDKQAAPGMEDPLAYDPADYEFIAARVTDNPIYAGDEHYLKTLRALPSHLRRAFLDGDWEVFAGQSFDKFDTSRQVVRAEAIDWKPWWPRWIGLLRRENRALLNSILGIAGLPPIVVSTAPDVERIGLSAPGASDEPPLDSDDASLAPPGGHLSRMPIAAQPSESSVTAAGRQAYPQNSGSPSAALETSSLPRSIKNTSTRRRSWPQIHRALEIAAAQKVQVHEDSSA